MARTKLTARRAEKAAEIDRTETCYQPLDTWIQAVKESAAALQHVQADARTDDLSILSDEVLSEIMMWVGFKPTRGSKHVNVRLHRVWQGCVRSLDASASSIGLKDLSLLVRYTQLQHLTLNAVRDIGHPAIALFQALRELSSLKIAGQGACKSLITASRFQECQTRLRRLVLVDEWSSLIMREELEALATLRALTQLQLEGQGIQGDEDLLQHIGSQLSNLRDLKLYAWQPSPASALLAGACTGLTSLSLADHFGGRGASLADVVAALTSLRELHTNYLLPGSKEQQLSLLQPLEELTKLSLDIKNEPMTKHEDIGEFRLEVLAALTQLRELHAPFYRLMAQGAQGTQAWQSAVGGYYGRLGRPPPAAPAAQVAAVFQHPSLRALDIYDLPLPGEPQTAAAAQGRAAASAAPAAPAAAPAACQLELLGVHRRLPEEQLRRLPHMPCLKTFFATSLEAVCTGYDSSYTISERYPQTSALLKRYSSTLERVKLAAYQDLRADVFHKLLFAYQEALPRALPLCRELDLSGMPCSSHTLALLSMVSLPALERLVLNLEVPVERDDGYPFDAQQDLLWLRELPRLQHLHLLGLDGGVAQAALEVLRCKGGLGSRVKLLLERAQHGDYDDESEGAW